MGELFLEGGALDSIFLVSGNISQPGCWCCISGLQPAQSIILALPQARHCSKYKHTQRVWVSLQVRNQEGGAPQVVVVSSGVAFQDLQLTVHAASADWLYQVGLK